MSPRPAVASWLVAALLAVGALVGGCYETPKPACAFACARDDLACPEGYECDPQDQICHRQLPGGGLEACDQPFLDAAGIDAPTIDASPIDAGVDAPIDASPDA